MMILDGMRIRLMTMIASALLAAPEARGPEALEVEFHADQRT